MTNPNMCSTPSCRRDRWPQTGRSTLRVRGAPEASFAAIRAAIAQAEPTLPVVELRTLDDQITHALRDERMLATLSSAFGGIAFGAFDGPTVAHASGLLVVVTLGAAMLPAWRAASVRPTEALRFD